MFKKLNKTNNILYKILDLKFHKKIREKTDVLNLNILFKLKTENTYFSIFRGNIYFSINILY